MPLFAIATPATRPQAAMPMVIGPQSRMPWRNMGRRASASALRCSRAKRWVDAMLQPWTARLSTSRARRSGGRVASACALDLVLSFQALRGFDAYSVRGAVRRQHRRPDQPGRDAAGHRRLLPAGRCARRARDGRRLAGAACRGCADFLDRPPLWRALGAAAVGPRTAWCHRSDCPAWSRARCAGARRCRSSRASCRGNVRRSLHPGHAAAALSNFLLGRDLPARSCALGAGRAQLGWSWQRWRDPVDSADNWLTLGLVVVLLAGVARRRRAA